MTVPAVVTAGDSRAARAVKGQSKVYLEVDGLPLVAHVVLALQAVPEVDDVWVVGNRERLEAVFDESLRARLVKPLHLMPQQRDLVENCWEAYRRILSGDPDRGRDPETEADRDRDVFYVSGDLPFATPQELSAFVQAGLAKGVDYVLGLVSAESLVTFRPEAPGEPGIDVAYYNIRDGRLRQSNLHLAKPARIGKRERIEEMYEHRHQREFWNMAVLAAQLVFSRAAGLRIAVLYGLMVLAGYFDRIGWSRLSRSLARAVTLDVNRRTVGGLLDTRFEFVITEAGGCAIDVDTDEEYDAICARYDDWIAAQRERAERLYGPPALPARAGHAAG